MNRRDAVRALIAAPAPLLAAQTLARRGLPPVKITDVKVILTEIGGIHLVSAQVW